jgi:hypothetical protein
MPAVRFIERRNKAALVEKVGPFERSSDLFWRECGWKVRIAELHNTRRSEPMSWQTVHVVDGDAAKS